MSEEERIEISIVWQNGKIMMHGPGNPVIIMRVLGDALSAAADEFLKIAMEKKSSVILKPGPDVAFADARVVQEVQKNIQKNVIAGR